MSGAVGIVKNKLYFQDILDKRVSYVDAWRLMVEAWLFEPAKKLASERGKTDRGIAILTLELSFFEPLGSILSGEDSDRNSKKTFCRGLAYFADWLSRNGLIGENERALLSVGATKDDPNVFYSFARCGLMHNMGLKGGRIFIDAEGRENNSICEHYFPIKSKSKNGSVQEDDYIILIDPWRLLNQIERFFNEFVNKLKNSSRDDEFYRAFSATFERTVVNPGKLYLNRVS